MARELDAKVAEKVMGWLAPGYYEANKDSVVLWKYTTDPAADYQVLKHVRETWPKNEMELDGFDKFLSALAQMWDERCHSFECGLSYGSGYGHGAKLGRMYEPGDYSRAALLALGESIDGWSVSADLQF